MLAIMIIGWMQLSFSLEWNKISPPSLNPFEMYLLCANFSGIFGGQSKLLKFFSKPNLLH
jgi:hypothetical protein